MTCVTQVILVWRRERDSNPRWDSRPTNDLANRPLQPLGYLSVLGFLLTGVNYSRSRDHYLLLCTRSVTILLMDEHNSEWAYSAEIDNEAQAEQQTRPHHEPIAWTGSEFIAQHKSASWYLCLIAALVVACGVIYLLSKDILSIVFVLIMGILFGIIASKKPRELQYSIDDQGIGVGNRHYSFSDFKTFSIMRDGAIGYISLLPLQRLHPELTIYYAPENEQQIFDTLSTYLPHEDRPERVVDKFARTIRF